MMIDNLALILRGLPPVRLQAARRETVSAHAQPTGAELCDQEGLTRLCRTEAPRPVSTIDMR
jgi:hypothetical protein